MNILETLRQFRIGQYAIFDLVVSFLAMYLLAPWLTKLFRKINLEIPKRNWLYLTLPIGFLTHLIFRAFTPMTVNLLDLNGHYWLKLVMLVLTILGLHGIKIVKRK